MLARALPGVVVAVGPRRDVVGRAVEARFGARVHVLDDGFQHLRLERDLDVVCLDVRDLDDSAHARRAAPREPGGPRRGPDLVLLTRLEAAAEEELPALEGRLGPGRTYRVARRSVGWRTLDGEDAASPGAGLPLRRHRPAPSASNATPAPRGPSVVGRTFFGDHHRYRAEEIALLAATPVPPAPPPSGPPPRTPCGWGRRLPTPRTCRSWSSR